MPRSKRLTKRQRAFIEKYIESQSETWRSEKTRQSHHYIIYHLFEWLERRNLREENLTPVLVSEFIRRPAEHEIGRLQQKNYRVSIRRYLDWRKSLGKIKISATELIPLHRKPFWPLPALGYAFLNDPKNFRRKKTFRSYRSTIGHFHHWLTSEKITVEAINESCLLQFDEYLQKKNASAFYRQTSDQRLRVYLLWLHRSGISKLTNPETCTPPQAQGPRLHVKLTIEAESFLDVVAINRRESTVKNYKNAIDHLYFFLNGEKIKVANLKRRDFERWLQHLKSLELGPMTRKGLILCIRYYLFWLEEHGKIQTDVDTLLRLSDCPKIPEYLPKPLHPSDDLKLQAHLTNSGELLKKALLLIRLTGLRIGEAVALTGDCLWQDHAGHRYLKVPLGKLDKERMVPVDNRGFEIINWHLNRTRKVKGETFIGNLMVSDSGLPLCVRDLRFALHTACRDVKILERVNVHRLRHYAESRIMPNGHVNNLHFPLVHAGY